MIKNSFNVIKSVVEHLNSRQTPVIAFDQPLYALAKQVQWNKYLVMCGGLYIVTAALKTLGDWLREQTMYSVAVEVINNAQGTGGQQFQAFVKECLIKDQK